MSDMLLSITGVVTQNVGHAAQYNWHDNTECLSDMLFSVTGVVTECLMLLSITGMVTQNV